MISSVVSSPQAISLALQGALWAMLLTVLSLVNVQMGDVKLGFSLLPLIAVYLWPRGAHYIWSIWLVCLTGLLQDFLTDGPLGMWAVINCAMFIIVDPSRNNKSKLSFQNHWMLFVLFACLSAVLAFCLGRISLGQWPPFVVLLSHMVLSVSLFPFVFWLYRLGARFGGDPDFAQEL